MSDKVKVFYIKTDDSAPSSIIQDDLEAVFEWIRADFEGQDTEQEYEYTIGIMYMTNDELTNLLEADL